MLSRPPLRTVPPTSDPLRRLAWRRLWEEFTLRTGQLAALRAEAESNPELRSDQLWWTLCDSASSALAEVDLALARLALPSFGRCEACAEPISPERLEVLPEAARCTGCQQVHESGSRTRSLR